MGSTDHCLIRPKDSPRFDCRGLFLLSWPADRLAAGASPAQRPGPNCTSPARSANDPHHTVCRSSDSVAPKGDSMRHKSVPLLIKSADDDSGAFTGLASVFDNLDHDGDIVRRGACSKSLGRHTPIPPVWMQRLMTHAAMSVMSSRPPRPTTVWRSGRF